MVESSTSLGEKVSAVVLDFGNVLGFFNHHLAADRLARASRPPVRPELIHAFCFGSPLDHAFERGQITREEFRSRVRGHFGMQQTDAEFDSAFADIFEMNPVVDGWLEHLSRQGPLLLLSNTSPLHSDRFLRQFSNSLRYFDHVVLSHNTGSRKPEQGIFRHCERLVGLAAPQMVLVDDLETNVAGARAHGWRGVLYDTSVDLAQVMGA
ncbi:MAG: HAD family phosphatase [Planctomycetota bacterium]|nr:HAD family phosphatase [Planctomycetota bacterium]